MSRVQIASLSARKDSAATGNPLFSRRDLPIGHGPHGIHSHIAWAKTSHDRWQYDLEAAIDFATPCNEWGALPMTVIGQHKPKDGGCLHSQAVGAPPIRRLSEAAAWDAIPADFQRRISMIAVAYAVAAMEQAETGQSQAETTEARAFRTGEEALGQLLRAAIIEAVPALRRSTTPPVPKLLGRVYRSCGCTDHAPCAGGSRWIAPDQCSACTGPCVHASKEAGADLRKHLVPRSSRTIQEFPHAQSQKEPA